MDGSVTIARPRLLLLCHRIPYPPDKGDKIRAWRWLLALARDHRVALVAFVDDPADFRHRAVLARWCERLLLVPLTSRGAKLRSLVALLTGEPLTARYYRDGRVSDWLAAEHAREPFAAALVYSSAMGQYVSGPRWQALRRVIDFVDVDSDKWRQYAARMRGPLRLIYAREAHRLLAHDAALAAGFDLSLFVSQPEARLFIERAGVGLPVASVANGVDGTYFAPDPARATPYPAGTQAIVFTGAMDYWANVDAVAWFVREAWPLVTQRAARAVFYIVGARPAAAVTALAAESVVVTGRVADVRPWLQYATVVVAPMRIARGIQNKVLEGMAMGRPLVVTTAALEGLVARPDEEVLVADAASDFADAVLAVLSTGAPQAAARGAAARALVLDRYDWAHQSERFLALVDGRAVSEDV